MSAAPREPTLVSAFVPQFEAARVDYFATGGYAAILYGEPRLTTDLDVVMALGRHEVARLHAAFDPHEYYVPPPEVMLEEATRPRHGHFNIYHNDTGLRSDVYLVGEDATEAWAMEHRRRFDVDGGLWVSPPEYVIAHKLTFRRDGGSEKHVRDVRAMLAVSGDAIDRALLAGLVDRLGVRRQWDEVVGPAPRDAA